MFEHLMLAVKTALPNLSLISKIDAELRQRALMEAKMFYRRKSGRDTWHFCGNCSRWPEWDFEEREKKPKSGEMCNECRGKVKNNKCKKVVGHGD